MRMIGFGAVGLALVLALVGGAEANQPPGPQMLLAEVVLLPLMVLLSLAGGAYAVLRALQPRGKRWRLLRAASAVLAILLSGASEGIGFVVAWIFGILGLQRGVQMVRWGLGAREDARPAHLAAADPRRLLPAGIALLVLTIALLGLVVAFAGYAPIGEGRRQETLRQFLVYQIAVGREAQARTGRLRFRPVEAGDTDPRCRPPVRLPDGARIEYAPDESGFTILLPPRARFPFFPYNHLTSQPSFRADSTGRIRMIEVHDRESLCPADAPVVAEISDADVERMQRLLAGTWECQEALDAQRSTSTARPAMLSPQSSVQPPP